MLKHVQLSQGQAHSFDGAKPSAAAVEMPSAVPPASAHATDDTDSDGAHRIEDPLLMELTAEPITSPLHKGYYVSDLSSEPGWSRASRCIEEAIVSQSGEIFAFYDAVHRYINRHGVSLLFAFDIDCVLALTDKPSSPAMLTYLMRTAAIVEAADYVHYVLPFVMEWLQLITAAPKRIDGEDAIKIAFFSGGMACRNIPFVQNVLRAALGQSALLSPSAIDAVTAAELTPEEAAVHAYVKRGRMLG